MTPWMILDIATAAIPNAADYITADPADAPSNYGAEAAAKWAQKEAQKKLERAGLDLDLARLTAIGVRDGHSDAGLAITLCQTEDEERTALAALALNLSFTRPQLIAFNGFQFDLLILQRRARYLGLKFPTLNTDKYRSSNLDLLDLLTYRGAVARKSLSWYVKRLGWTDLVKPLSGEEEAQVPQSGRWDELRQSVVHDVEATYRLAQWLGVLPETDTRGEAIL